MKISQYLGMMGYENYNDFEWRPLPNTPDARE
jgi:hypothetical protein